MIQGLGIALIISLLATAAMGWLYKSSLENEAIARASLTQAISDAKECSDGVDRLQVEAEKHRLEAEKTLKLAKEAAKSARGKALKTLAMSPTDIKDMCASTTAMDLRKMAERRSR